MVEGNRFGALNPDEVPEGGDEGGVDAFDAMSRALMGLEDDDEEAAAPPSLLSGLMHLKGSNMPTMTRAMAGNQTMPSQQQQQHCQQVVKSAAQPAVAKQTGKKGKQLSRKQKQRMEKAREKAEASESKLVNGVFRNNKKHLQRNRARSTKVY
eukprot:TRINITY_DN5583_c0_g2_i1.p1 TRINITY_DN5583_c0_g2~~TRINITY_DN5583_c0_g2_i1.p1  ORF type:complete len:153 (-),score=38.50 TRINITY_DN5583_c0_g2_i1:364-822(-)